MIRLSFVIYWGTEYLDSDKQSNPREHNSRILYFIIIIIIIITLLLLLLLLLLLFCNHKFRSFYSNIIRYRIQARKWKCML